MGTKRKRSPITVLRLRDLEQSKSAVLNSLTSPVCSRRTITRFASLPIGTALSRVSLLTASSSRVYRIFLEQAHYAPSTINLRLAAVAALLMKLQIVAC